MKKKDKVIEKDKELDKEEENTVLEEDKDLDKEEELKDDKPEDLKDDKEELKNDEALEENKETEEEKLEENKEIEESEDKGQDENVDVDSDENLNEQYHVEDDVLEDERKDDIEEIEKVIHSFDKAKVIKILKIISVILAIYYLLMTLITSMSLDQNYLYYYGVVDPFYRNIALSYTILPILSIIMAIIIAIHDKAKRVTSGALLVILACILILALGPLNLLLYGENTTQISYPVGIGIGLLALIGAIKMLLHHYYLEKDQIEKAKQDKLAQERLEEEARNQEIEKENEAKRKQEEIEKRISEIKNKTNKEKVVTIQHHHSLQDVLAYDPTADKEDIGVDNDLKNKEEESHHQSDILLHDDFDSKIVKLKKAKALHEQDIINDDDFELLKKEILGIKE